MLAEQLKEIYDLLFERFGPQDWWPGDTPFEVIVGAILTQNTNWTNVEKAITNLKNAKALSPDKLHRLDIKKLAELIRPAGYFNIKAKRLKNFLDWFFKNYSGKVGNFENIRTTELREQLLSVKGIGPETADSILLYALNRPVFVVDAYTARICSRHHLIGEDADYNQIQETFESNLPSDPASAWHSGSSDKYRGAYAETSIQLFNEYHALLVHLGKDFCKPTPKCEECPLNGLPHSI
ncbi:MAG: endonuclease III domain-containing protein [Sedimentisphaerales bacterium]|jgi:endonuclease-3 related protein